MKKVRLVFLTLALLAFGLNVGAAFADTSAIEVPLSVTIQLSGNVPSPAETFTVNLVPLSADNPMPVPATLTITGQATRHFSTLKFNRVGVYEYDVTFSGGSASNGEYDTRPYNLVVSITNAQGGGLESTVALRRYDDNGWLDMDVKTDHVVFEGEYAYPDTPKTSDESNLPGLIVMAVGATLVLLVLFVTRERKNAR